MPRARRYCRVRPQRNYKFRRTLAIDWGSEAVRTKLFLKTEHGDPIDQLLHHTSSTKGITTDRQEIGRQFSSQIYPFDHTSPNPPGETVYPGNNLLPGRRSISSKLGMYAVVGTSDEVSRQSTELQELLNQVQDNSQLKQIIRTGIQQILLHVLKAVYKFFKYCPEQLRGELDAISLTIPAQWTIDFEEEYGELLMAAWDQVFEGPAPQIIFLSEGQTNLHYALYRGTVLAMTDRNHLSELEFFDIGRSKNAVLVIDAGGHSTNTSLVTICDDDNQLEIRPDHGAIGGTALWAWHVLELAKRAWKKGYQGAPMPVEAENQVLKRFYHDCSNYRDDSGASFDMRNCSPNREIVDFALRPEKLVQAFENAFAHAFALIEKGLVELKDFRHSCETIKVVIGGGSAKGFMWMTRMRNLCDKHQIEEPIPLCQIEHTYEYARLAGGANYALAKAKSVAQFVEKAAFGLVVKKRFRGQNGWTDDWHYDGSTLLWAQVRLIPNGTLGSELFIGLPANDHGRHQGHKWARSITTDGSEDFKVICQPEYDNPRSKSVIKPNYRAYDLLPIPCHKKGTLQFDLEIDTNDDKLKLTINYRALPKSGSTGRSTELGRVEFDLWVPPGSRTLQIWGCIEDIETKVAAAFSHDQQAAGNDGSDGNDGGLPDAAPLLPAQPGALPRPPAKDVAMDGMEDGEDVDMGGIEVAEEIADRITVASVSDEAAQPLREQGGSQAGQRRRRRGSTMPTGIFTL